MWGLAGHTPALSLACAVRVSTATLFLVVGLGVMLAAVISFRVAKTTVNPLKPDAATALVTSGIFRYTRNPMYLGMLMVLVAWSAFLASPAALAGPLAFHAYISRFQIRPEETALSNVFGKKFLDYSCRVRRWL